MRKNMRQKGRKKDDSEKKISGVQKEKKEAEYGLSNIH